MERKIQRTIKWYQLTGRDMPLQKSSGVAIWCPCRIADFSAPIHRQDHQLHKVQMAKLGFVVQMQLSNVFIDSFIKE